MNQKDLNEQLRIHRIVPVVKLQSVEHAIPLAEALCKGGLPVAEVTLRTNCALKAIAAIARTDSVLLGAGTVLNKEQTQAAIEAGAQFIVSPGLDEEMVKYCLEQKIPIFPGVSTASEAQKALNLGLKVVKLFPAEAVGGAKLLKALAGPFHNMEFMPTGGINPENLNDYLSLSNVIAVGGSWMVKPNLFEGGDFSQVIKLTQAAVASV